MLEVRLPANPPSVRSLTDPELAWISRVHGGINPDWRGNNCKTCAGMGVFPWYWPLHSRDRATVAQYECDCKQQNRLRLYLTYCGVGSMYQRLGWADLSVSPEAEAFCHHWLDNVAFHIASGIGLVLHGPVGTGKTALAALLTKGVIEKAVYSLNAEPFMIEFPRLLDLNYMGWKDEENREWFNRRVRNASVLVIDDIGRERHKSVSIEDDEGKVRVVSQSTENVEAIIDSVLRGRLADGLPTIITTNKSLEDLRQMYRSNVHSLLQGLYRYHYIGGEDFRRKGLATRVEAETELNLVRPVVIR